MTTWAQLSEVQPFVVKMLTNSLKRDRLAHAYLIEGEKGTKKMTIAMQLAKSLLCLQKDGIEPCHTCRNCKRVDSHNHPDVHVIEPDGQSIKTEQVNQLKTEFSYRGVEADYKIYIMNHAEKMTPQASNKLLKFLEEPHPKTVAILLTDGKHQLLNTIRSRCQELTTLPLKTDALLDKLIREQAPKPLAKLSLAITNQYDECVELCNNEWFAQARNKVIQLTEELQKNLDSLLFFIQQQWMPHFADKEQVSIGLDLLLLWMKDVLHVQVGNEDVSFEGEVERMKEQALHFTQTEIMNNLSYILEAKKRLHANVNLQLLMEQLVLKLQEG